MIKIISLLILINFFSYHAFAQAPATPPVVSNTAPLESSGATSSIGKIKELLGTPPGIMVLSGIGLANSAILRQAASDQEEEAKKNAEKIDAILKTLSDSFDGHCPNGREKLEEPKCYCYLENGTKNSARTNSDICQNEWGKGLDYKLTANAKDYSNPSGILNPSGCVAKNGKFDEDCLCRKQVDSAGNNGCMKAGPINPGNNQLGTGVLNNLGINQVAANLDSTASGTSNLGSLTTKGLGKTLAIQNGITKDLFQRIKNEPNIKVYDNKEIAKAQAAIFSKGDISKLSSALGGSALASAQASAPPPSIASEVKNARATNGLSMSGGNGLNKAAKVNNLSLNLGEPISSNGSAGQLNFMEKNYKVKQNDIVKKEEGTIFDIISNRYIESGLRRLFEDK